MSNRVLRGSGLGGVSFEDDRGVEFAPRQMITYDCPRGSRVIVKPGAPMVGPPLSCRGPSNGFSGLATVP